MKRPSVLKEEVLHYLSDEWDDSLKTHKNGKWLTTRAIQLKLETRGLVITWPTLKLRLNALLMEDSVKMIETSNGMCWKPISDIFRI